MNDGIREKISRLLGVMIPPGKWEQYLDMLDKNGVPNRKQLIGLVLIICQHLESLENVKADLESQITALKVRIESLESKNVTNTTKSGKDISVQPK